MSSASEGQVISPNQGQVQKAYAAVCSEGSSSPGTIGAAGESLAAAQSARFDGAQSAGSVGGAVSAAGGKKCFNGFTAASSMKRGLGTRDVPLSLAQSQMRESRALSNVIPGGPVVMQKYYEFQKTAYDKAYGVMDRLGWGARKRKGSDVAISPARITVHHTEGHTPSGEKATADMVKDIQHYHMVGRALEGKEAFSDIGYHFLVAGDGRVIQGRQSNVLGAHAHGANKNNIGIALMGNFNKKNPTADQMESIKRLIAYVSVKYGIDPQRSGALEGHGHYTATDCPGSHLRSQLAALRIAAAEEMVAMRGRGQVDLSSLHAGLLRPVPIPLA